MLKEYNTNYYNTTQWLYLSILRLLILFQTTIKTIKFTNNCFTDIFIYFSIKMSYATQMIKRRRGIRKIINPKLNRKKKFLVNNFFLFIYYGKKKNDNRLIKS